jgi:hypothetical protein
MSLERLCENRDIWGDDGFDVADFLRTIASPRVADVPAFAGWVQEAALEHDLNPRILLAIAQKEQSFLTRAGSGTGWQRALQWTMGYGATDSGDIPKYAGTQRQVFAAAAGLRRYWDAHLVQPMVGRPLGQSLSYITDAETRAIIPANEATAALYLYTPHAHGGRTFAQVWAWLTSIAPTTRRPAEPSYPPAGTAIKIVIQYGEEYVLLGEGIFDGQVVQVPVRMMAQATEWATKHVGSLYRFVIVDHVRTQGKAYVVVVPAPAAAAEEGE